MRRDGTITWEHVRHEEAAAFAAAADAAVTGDLAVCAASCGPGNLHLINGLFDANRSGVPVLAIAAHIPAEEIGGEYFQETHPQDLFRECSVYCELVSTHEQLPRILQIAMRSALARGGVAVVVVPGEIFLTEAKTAAEPAEIRASASVIRPSDSALVDAASALFGVRVDKADELEDAVTEAFGHDGPALVDVHTARHELSLPPKLTYGEIKGFTLYATRTVLSGGGEELFELAKTNLRELDLE